MNESNIVHVDFAKPVRMTGDDKVLLRDIWEQLKTGYQFSDWVKRELAIFEENQELVRFKLLFEFHGDLLSVYPTNLSFALSPGMKYFGCENLLYPTLRTNSQTVGLSQKGQQTNGTFDKI